MIVAAFGLMYVSESSVLGVVRVLHVFRHFMIIIIIIIAVVFTININIIFITFIIISYSGFLSRTVYCSYEVS